MKILKNKFPSITITLIIILSLVFVALNKTKTSNFQEWITYTNQEKGFSFSYPKYLGESEILDDKKENKFAVSFDHYAFEVDNGYYFSDLNGKRPTIKQLIESFERDSTDKNGIKYYTISSIKIGGYMAERFDENVIDQKKEGRFVDIFVYIDQNDASKFLHIVLDKGLMSDEDFQKILNSFKFIE